MTPRPMWEWLTSDDPVEDDHMCAEHAILTEMLFREDGDWDRPAAGAEFTICEVVDDYTTLRDADGNLWSVVGDWRVIVRAK